MEQLTKKARRLISAKNFKLHIMIGRVSSVPRGKSFSGSTPEELPFILGRKGHKEWLLLILVFGSALRESNRYIAKIDDLCQHFYYLMAMN